MFYFNEIVIHAIITIHCMYLIVAWIFLNENYARTLNYKTHGFMTTIWINPGKCNFMCSNFKLKKSFVNKISGVIIDRELKFDKCVK